MIRKISTQDVVTKRGAKNTREDDDIENDPNRRERDFLIERLTRKHNTASIAESPVKVTKSKTRSSKSTGGFFSNIKLGNKWIWLGAPILLIVLLFGVLQLMAGATVTVQPKKVAVPVDTKLVASLTATTSPAALMYQIITLNASDSETVAATGTVKTAPQKATGEITIFNNHSRTAQTLVKNTRFETPDGLIYRIQNTISVPGFTGSSASIVPGSLTVKVVADQVGSNYNVGLTDFTIPGFKTDTNRYTKIFARSKTVMVGGSDGNSFGVSEEVRVAAQTAMQARLRENLIRQAQAQKTANSVIFDGATKISFQHMSDTAGGDAQQVVLHEQGTISAIVFDKVALGKLLLGDAVSQVGGNAEVRGMEELHFIAAVSSTAPIWQAKPFAFTLTGLIDVIGIVDAEKLVQDIRGVPRSDIAKVLSNYPTVDKVNAVIKPFWKSSFPVKASQIKVEIVK